MLLILGDVHAQWDDLRGQFRAAKEFSPKKLSGVVQLGDLGVWQGYWKDFPGSSVPFYFIEGNHESFPFLRELTRESTEVVSLDKPNTFYVPRGATFQLGGKKWMGLGGCRMFSPPNCPPGSVFTEEEIDQCLKNKKVDIIITHDGPSGLGIHGHPAFGGGLDVGAPQLQKLYSLKPRMWFFGHHHQSIQMENQGVRHYGLDCCDKGFGLFDPKTWTFAWRGNVLGYHQMHGLKS